MAGIDALLYKKRFGGELTREEIHEFVSGVTEKRFADYQISAMLMAIAINGMSESETVDLTMEMASSGDMLDLSGISGVKVDKHSTGGVGDTTSLVLAPLVACCGVKVAKMSGRGLGFTGGTLDKLEAIPGFSVSMDTERFMRSVDRMGLAIIGQTASLAPCDKVLYALRDVTATVDVMPLIVSSILSKKIASGADVIVLDVKVGSGAMMKTVEDARRLAKAMVSIGSRTGRRFAALLTDMNQPLGRYVGNALEVEEALDILAGRTEGDLKQVALRLGAQMLRLSGAVETADEGVRLLESKIASGEGLAKFAEMIANQGGDPKVVYDTSLLPKAEKRLAANGKNKLREAKKKSVVRQFFAQMADNLVHQHDDGHPIFFRKTDGAHRQLKSFRHTRRRYYDNPMVAMRSPTAHHDLALGRRRWLARGRTDALHVNDDDGNFGNAGKAEHFLFQRKSWA